MAEKPRTIHRLDYRPPAFLVDSADLRFDLDPAATVVRACLVLRRNRWSWQALERGDLKLGDEVLDIDRLQWWLINADPVLWVETNLVNRPEDGGGLWQLFPYQRPSLRFRGHVVHQEDERREPSQTHRQASGFQSGAVHRWNTRATESRGLCQVSGRYGLT